MSEAPAESNTPAPEPQEGTAEAEESKTFDADYVEKLRKEAAKYRTEAKANADAAKRLAEIEESSKTEAQRLAERAEAAERELAVTRQAAVRAEIALEKGLTQSQAKRLLGETREELEADADELLKDIGATNGPRAPRPDPNQGRQSGGTASTADQFAAAIGAQFTT